MAENPYEAPSSPTPPRQKMRRSVKIALIVLGCLALFTVASIVGLAILCTSQW